MQRKDVGEWKNLGEKRNGGIETGKIGIEGKDDCYFGGECKENPQSVPFLALGLRNSLIK